MDSLQDDAILEFQPGTLEAVRKIHGFNKLADMANAIDVFEEWIKQQNHFTFKDFERGYLERLIICSKGSVERAKQRLDKLCTLRTLLPHYFGDYNTKEDFKNLDNVFAYTPLPKMTDKYERLFLIVNSGKHFDDDIFLNGYRNFAMVVEYFKFFDYADSCVFVCDLREVNMTEVITKIGLIECRQLMTLLTTGYGLRPKGIYFLTSSMLIDTFVGILKQVMSEKLGSRIKVFRTLESLYEIVPKECLPKEYGGEGMPIDKLKEKWSDVLSSDSFRHLWRSMCAARTDESLRQTDKFNDQYMGMPGTFRTLSVD